MIEITGNKFRAKKEYKVGEISYFSPNEIVVIEDLLSKEFLHDYTIKAFNISKGIDFNIECNMGSSLHEYLEPINEPINDDFDSEFDLDVQKKFEQKTSFEQVLEEMKSTYIKKNSDYGNSFDQSLDKFGLIASVVRLGDKMNRIESLTKNPDKQQVHDESIRDTFMDMANYCAMTVAWMDKQK